MAPENEEHLQMLGLFLEEQLYEHPAKRDPEWRTEQDMIRRTLEGLQSLFESAENDGSAEHSLHFMAALLLEALDYAEGKRRNTRKADAVALVVGMLGRGEFDATIEADGLYGLNGEPNEYDGPPGDIIHF